MTGQSRPVSCARAGERTGVECLLQSENNGGQKSGSEGCPGREARGVHGQDSSGESRREGGWASEPTHPIPELWSGGRQIQRWL